jgi:ribosome-associated translation inhibitor RaiA
MKSPLQVTFRNLAHSTSLTSQIEERVARLEAMCDRIISCHVVVELAGHKHRSGGRFHFSINVGLPGHEVIANRTAHEGAAPETPEASADRAFDEAERQLETWMDRQRAGRHEQIGSRVESAP